MTTLQAITRAVESGCEVRFSQSQTAMAVQVRRKHGDRIPVRGVFIEFDMLRHAIAPDHIVAGMIADLSDDSE